MQPSVREQFSLFVDHEGKIVRSTRYQRHTKKRENLWIYVGLVGDIGLTIAMPIALSVFVGGLLDHQFASYPRWTLGLLVAGSIISVVGFVQILKELIRRTR